MDAVWRQATYKDSAARDRGDPLGVDMAAFSLFMMFLALVLNGLSLWARDAVTQNLPSAFFVSDVVWTASLLSLFFFWRYPWVTVISGWGLFLILATILWPFDPPHTVAAFLYQNIFELTNLTFAHVGFHFRRRQQRRIKTLVSCPSGS